MIVKNGSIRFKTRAVTDIIDITAQLEKIVAGSQVSDGMVNIFVPGATGAVTAIECENGLLEDFKDFLEEIIPEGGDYKHNLSHSGRNGHSHIRASLIGPSITIPVRNCISVLGTWQQVVFIEMDSRPRDRTLMVTIIGHGKTSNSS